MILAPQPYSKHKLRPSHINKKLYGIYTFLYYIDNIIDLIMILFLFFFIIKASMQDRALQCWTVQ